MNNVVVGHVSKQQKAHIHVKRPSNPVKSQDLSSRYLRYINCFRLKAGPNLFYLNFLVFFFKDRKRENLSTKHLFTFGNVNM